YVTNGADHHAQQPDLDTAIAALKAVALPDRVMRTSLSNFASRLLEAVKANGDSLPTITGELRNSYGYTWTLNGTFGTRAAQKRDNARAERALLRDVEPWLVLAWLHGNAAQNEVAKDGSITMAQAPALLDVAWRTLLRAHPHDTLCGCSVDAVALAMNGRLASTMTQAEGLRIAALALALNRNAVEARSQAISLRPPVVIRNRSARRRRGIVELVLDETVRNEGVGPSSAVMHETMELADTKIPHIAGKLLQTVKSKIVNRRRESPQHYPDNDVVRAHYVLGWLDAIPPLGLSMRTVSFVAENSAENSVIGLHENVELFKDGFPDDFDDDPFKYERSGMMEFNPSKLRVLEDAIELRNDSVTVSASTNGIALSLGYRDEMIRSIQNAISFDTTRDDGDSYTPAMRGDAEPLILRTVKAGLPGPLRASVHALWSSAGKRNRISVRATFSLDAYSEFVRVDLRGDNQRRNHRLRMNFATDVSVSTEKQVWADAAFGPVLRKPIRVPLEDQTCEVVPPTMPMHRWVATSNGSLGATLHADGLAEVEVRDDGNISLTLVRAIGQLSRNNLPERPGHAGWPANIPLAQSIGKFRARVGLHLHNAWSSQTRDEIEIASDALLLPLTGETWRDLYDYPHELDGPELQGTELRWSTATLADDNDGIVLRCTSDSDIEQPGSWKLPAGAWEFARERLDETLLEDWHPTERRIEFSVPPLGTLTLRVRRRAH
ncbi:MAG: glycoside hydrolase family 38 C-terminal domain-containing protein, partial [Gemmatimonadaceae bacterium]